MKFGNFRDLVRSRIPVRKIMATNNKSTEDGCEKMVSIGTNSRLQLRYTELLEKRITQLESLLDDKSGTSKKQSSSGLQDSQAQNSRYRYVVRQWNKSTGSPKDVELDAVQEKEERTQWVFTFRRVFDKDEKIKAARSEITIEGEELRSILKQVIGSEYPGQNLDGDTVVMSGSFSALIHNWDKLEAATKDSPDEIAETGLARQDLRELLKAVRNAPELEEFFKTRDSNRSASIVTFDSLWTLFAPQTRIVTKMFLNLEQVFVVHQSPTPIDAPPPRRGLYTIVWCWDWMGRSMKKVFYHLEVDYFFGTKRIDELPFYPIQYYKDGAFGSEAKLCEALRLRGEKFDKIEEISRLNYKSHDYMFSAGYKEKMRRAVLPLKGNYIVDAQAFFEHGNGIPKIGEIESTRLSDLNVQSSVYTKRSQDAHEDLILFPPRVLGFFPKEKIWGQFSVDQTSPGLGKRPKVFEEQLQLDLKYKRIIHALVQEHVGRKQEESDDRAQFEDLVEGKGKGLVLLLHGAAGVGKTLTAEAIAESSAKPLLIIGVAEIGLYPSDAEKNLEKIFSLASKWDAILVDEADVFLEARSAKTGTLVSVLLRALEYYHGIMILTTNRVTVIDIAVQSRIHLAIRYDDLNADKKKQIFRLFLDRLPPDDINDRERIDEYIDDYGVRAKLNGRQIRNIVSSAASLARNSAKQKGGNGDTRLTDKHLKQVVNHTVDFHDQLEGITMQQRLLNEVKGAR